jgi:hypothetical protein
MQTILSVARSVTAVVAGYAAMVVLITLVQERLFGGVSWGGSSWAELIGAGILTFLGAVAGGAIAAWIGGSRAGWHAAAMGALVVVETTTLIVTGRVTGPLWFDLGASSSLIAGILIGACLVAVWKQRRRADLAGDAV